MKNKNETQSTVKEACPPSNLFCLVFGLLEAQELSKTQFPAFGKYQNYQDLR